MLNLKNSAPPWSLLCPLNSHPKGDFDWWFSLQGGSGAYLVHSSIRPFNCPSICPSNIYPFVHTLSLLKNSLWTPFSQKHHPHGSHDILFPHVFPSLLLLRHYCPHLAPSPAHTVGFAYSTKSTTHSEFFPLYETNSSEMPGICFSVVTHIYYFIFITPWEEGSINISIPI